MRAVKRTYASCWGTDCAGKGNLHSRFGSGLHTECSVGLMRLFIVSDASARNLSILKVPDSCLTTCWQETREDDICTEVGPHELATVAEDT